MVSLIWSPPYSSYSRPPGKAASGKRQDVAFFSQLLRRARISCTAYIIALLYLHRLWQRFHSTNTTTTTSNDDNRNRKGKKKMPEHWRQPRELWLISIVVADKYVSDITYDNQDWCQFTLPKIPLERINQLECLFLKDLDYQLGVNAETYCRFLEYLDWTMLMEMKTGHVPFSNNFGTVGGEGGGGGGGGRRSEWWGWNDTFRVLSLDWNKLILSSEVLRAQRRERRFTGTLRGVDKGGLETFRAWYKRIGRVMGVFCLFYVVSVLGYRIFWLDPINLRPSPMSFRKHYFFF